MRSRTNKKKQEGNPVPLQCRFDAMQYETHDYREKSRAKQRKNKIHEWVRGTLNHSTGTAPALFSSSPSSRTPARGTRGCPVAPVLGTGPVAAAAEEEDPVQSVPAGEGPGA